MTRLRPTLLLAISVILTLPLLAKEALASRALPQNEAQPIPSLPLATDGDPGDLSTGLYVLDETDVFLPDVIPITFIRTYRPGDPASRPLGIGTMHSYELYLQRNGLCSEMRLILPDGGRIRYLRTAGTNCYDSTLVHTSTPTRFNESSLRWEKNEQKWVLRRKDGSIYRFASGGLDRAMTPFMSVVDVQDASGNILTIARDKLGRITSMTSPCGLWARFSYDQGNRITKISDILGRETMYEYDAAGRLLSVRYPDGQASRYTYDDAHQMLTIDDKSGLSFSHRYDVNGRVIEQAYPDGGTYQFRYVTDDKGNIRITLVKNLRGHVRIVTFNDTGYAVRDTRALGRPEEHTTIYEWQEGTDRLLQTLEYDASTPSYDGNDPKKKTPPAQGETSARVGGQDPIAGNDPSAGNSETIGQQVKLVPLENIPTDERGELTTPLPSQRFALCRGKKALSRVNTENPWNRKELDNVWEQLIRYEQYEIIQFLDRHSSNPTTHAQSRSNTLLLEDRRESYLWGGLRGGGWTVEGRLESELPVEGGIWQLYAKAVTRWFPGLANLLQPWHKDRFWEFQLILRNAVNRQEITQLKSVSVLESDIISGVTSTQSTVERVPRGQLLYDEAQGVVSILILGVKKPVEVEVAVVSSFTLFPSKPHDGDETASPSSLDLFRSGSKYYIQNKFAEAIGPYQRAVDLEKQDPKLDKILWRVLVDNLGMAYGVTGDLKRAKETLEHGLSKDPTYSMFHYNLACTYAEMGDLDGTMNSLKNAYTYRANHNPGEHMPDPRTDSSFQRFMKNDTFLKFS